MLAVPFNALMTCFGAKAARRNGGNACEHAPVKACGNGGCSASNERCGS